MTTKQRKALYTAAAIGVLLAAPVLYLKWLDAEGDPFADDLGAVPEFLATDATGQAMSRFDLDGNLTFVAWLGEACVDPASAPCVRARAQLGALDGWIAQSLLYKDQDEQTPVRLVAVTPAAAPAPTAWRAVAPSDDAAALRPAACAAGDAPLVVIDQTAHARRCFPLAGAADWTELKPLLSRMTINHYMHDYLAKRTFFRRTPKDPNAPAEGETH